MLNASIFDMIRFTRKSLVHYLDKYSLAQLNEIPQGFNNNLVWNIGHIIAVQESLTYGLSGLRWTAPKELVKGYAKGTRPDVPVDQQFVDFLKKECIDSIDRLQENYQAGVFKEYKELQVATGAVLRNIDDAIQFNFFHEGLHIGYIMSIRKHLHT